MKLLSLVLMFLASSAAASPFAGKLDLGISPICYRELHDGVFMVGGALNVWDLMYTPRQAEVLHVGVQYSSHLGGPGTVYGLMLGTDLTAAGMSALQTIESVAALINEAPPWLKKIGTWTSVDIFGGYAPQPGVDLHPWSYGLGGKVKIPFADLQSWSTGASGVKGL
jgi:hypothetical protein